jgi:hypothetical protein
MVSTSTFTEANCRTSGGQRFRIDGAQFDNRIAGAALDAPRPYHQAGLAQRQFRRVEEHDLADLRLERVHAQGVGRGADRRINDSQLQLDAVGVLQQPEQLLDLFIVQGTHIVPRSLPRERTARECCTANVQVGFPVRPLRRQ